MLTPEKVLDNYYLDTRCMLVEIAATLDRYDRASKQQAGTGVDDRLDQIYQSLTLLADREATADRSERLLNLFSDLD
jgi:hypothetical protein